jgi:hypothetical protein
MYNDFDIKFKDMCKDDYLQSCMTSYKDYYKHTEATKLSEVINDILDKYSMMREIFEVSYTKFSSVSYAMLNFSEPLMWILPGLGYTADTNIELGTDEVSVPMFSIQAAQDWLLKYMLEEEYNIINEAAIRTAKSLISYETEAGWRVIIPAVTTSFDGAGILPPRPAAIHQLPSGDKGAGYFSKELINRLIVNMERKGQTLATLRVSPEDMADIREYTDTDIDPISRREIWQAAGMGKIWGITLEKDFGLGVLGQYNINDSSSNGTFKANENHRFNDYSITHGNIVDENYNLVSAGETQIYGFSDESKMNLKMPINKFQAHWDPALLRRQRVGFFGWEKIGLCCMDSSCLNMGVIDRYTP